MQVGGMLHCNAQALSQIVSHLQLRDVEEVREYFPTEPGFLQKDILVRIEAVRKM